MWQRVYRYWLVASLLSISFLSFSFAQLLNWQYEDILTDIQQPASFPAMVIDVQGNTHFTLWDAELNILYYALKNKRTGTLALERIPDTGTFGYRSAIKIARNGDIHIGYLHNNSGVSTLRHAIKTPAGDWTIERATPVDNIGIYGPDIQYPTYVQPSLDVFFAPNNEPGILYFDGRYLAIIRCDPAENGLPGNAYAGYRMDMNMAIKQGNEWIEQDFPDIKYTGDVPCLPTGDRFGEFGHMEQTSDGRYIAVTPSRHNHDLLVMVSAPNDLASWKVYAVDSTRRILASNNRDFWESYGFLDTELSGDTVLHVSYNLSNKYGVTTTFTNRQTAYYLQVHLDSLDLPGYTPIHHHATPTNRAAFHTALAVINPDTVVEVYYERAQRQLRTLTTYDRGQNWDEETILSLSTDGQVSAGVFEDSLFIYVHESLEGTLLELSKYKTDLSWQVRRLTRSQERGAHLSAQVVRTTQSDQVYVAFTEEETDVLTYGLRQNGQWTYEQVDTTNLGFGPVSLLVDDQGQPVIAYITESNANLRLAKRNGADWEVEIVVDSLLPLELSAVAFEGIFHLFFFDGSGRNLRHYAGNPTIGWTGEIVDSSSSIIGQRPRAEVTADGKLHVSYHDLASGSLKYGSKPVNGSWTLDMVGIPGEFSPSDNDLAIRSDGEPAIAFREGFRDSLFLAVRAGVGNWTVSNIRGDQNNLTGKPIRLILSQNDRPWVLYNFETVTTELRLVRLDENQTWQRVSVINNNAQLGRVFDFQLVDTDFYIVGKKNQPGNNGLGLLFASEGISTPIDGQAFQADWDIYPNPTSDAFTLTGPPGVDLLTDQSLTLYNTKGQAWHLNPSGAAEQAWQVSLPPLVPGLYVLKGMTSHGPLFEKVLIK